MIDNRWVLFGIYFVSLLTMHLLLSGGADLIEHLVTSLLTAAMLAYFSKYMKRFINAAVRKLLS